MDKIGEKVGQQDNLRPIDKKVLGNFFWSFHHSQGNPILQTLSSIYIARQYDKDDIGPTEDFEERLKPQIEKFKIPREHKREQYDEKTGKLVTVLDDKAAQENDFGFRAQWDRLRMVFNRVFYDTPNPSDDFFSLASTPGEIYKASILSPDNFLFEIVSHIVDKDLEYQQKVRPNREGESDPHSSHLQMYALDRIPTQSTEYNRLYGDLRGLLDKLGIINTEDVHTSEESKPELSDEKALSLKSKVQELAKKWEINHPGKQFIPTRT